MKPILIFICFLPLSLFGQESFFKAFEFGEGGNTGTGIKDEKIMRIHAFEDSYIYQMNTVSDGLDAEIVHKYVKIDRDFNVIWEVTFLADYLYEGEEVKYNVPANIQENIIIDSFLYSLTNLVFIDRRGTSLTKINHHTGELVFNRVINEFESHIARPFYFQQNTDSTFVFSGVSVKSMFHLVPAIVEISFDADVIGVQEFPQIFPDSPAVVIDFTTITDSTFNLIYYKWDGESSSSGWLHNAELNKNGTIVRETFLGDHTLDGVWAFERKLENGNRLIVTQLDTATSFVQFTGAVTKFYELDEFSNIVKDTVFDNFSTFPRPSSAVADTVLSLIDITKSTDGSIFILFAYSAPLNSQDNRAEPMVVKINKHGEMQWRKRYSSFEFENNINRLNPINISMDTDGGVLVSGNVSTLIDTITNEETRTAFIMKLDSNGCYNTNCEGGYLFTSTDEIATIKYEPLANISPNPTSDFINISPLENEKYSFRLFDVNGINLFQMKHVIEKQQINVHNYSSGVYFLEIIQGRRKFTQQIIKQ